MQTRKAHRFLGPRTKLDVVDDRAHGYTVTELAARHDISTSTVRRVLSEARVPRRLASLRQLLEEREPVRERDHPLLPQEPQRWGLLRRRRDS